MVESWYKAKRKKRNEKTGFFFLTSRYYSVDLAYNPQEIETMYYTGCCDDVRDARLCPVMSSDEERKLADSISRTVQRARIRAKYIVLYGFDPFKVSNRGRVDMVALERLFKETPLT